jgi:hypothetical protein
MTKLTFTLIIIALAAVQASSQWKKDDNRVGDSPDRKSSNGFGAQFLVVKDPQNFIQEWLKPKQPNIKTATKVNQGETLGALVLFAGCKTDDSGKCNTEVDYTLSKPDGSVLARRVGQPLWKEAPPPPPNIQLGRAILAFQINQKFPEGEYKVTAKVTDLNAGVSLDLETKFTVK